MYYSTMEMAALSAARLRRNSQGAISRMPRARAPRRGASMFPDRNCQIFGLGRTTRCG